MRYVIPLSPIGKGRPRHTRDGRAYTPESTRQWEAAAAAHLAYYAGFKKVTSPCYVLITANFRRPKTNKTQFHAQKPDADNVAKIVLDAMVKAGVLKDDAQVVWLSIRKQWADDGDVVVEVEELC